MGSILLHACTGHGNVVSNRHFIVDGFSQWLVGRDVAKGCHTEHVDDSRLVLSTKDVFVPLLAHDLHSFVSYGIFYLMQIACRLKQLPRYFRHSSDKSPKHF